MTDPQRTGYGLLLVEDQERLGETRKELLENHGHTVLLYHDGLKVLDDLRKEGIIYSVAIVDRQLDDIDGDDVIKALKKEYPHRPIICASCSPFGVGYVDATIQKPFTSLELDKLIRQLMTRM